MTQHNDDNINNERLGDAPTQSNCTDLINQAISTLQEALTACACPVTCDCSGQFITCLADASVFLFDSPTPTMGSVTLQSSICNQCDPTNSSLLFSFIENNQPGPITFESEAITKVCCTAATIMSVTGSGTLSIDGFLIPADYIFAFGSIAGQCFFGFRVGPADHPVLKIEEFVSCDSIISITPCTSSSTMPTSMGIRNPEVLGVNGSLPSNQWNPQNEALTHNQSTGPKGAEPCSSCSENKRAISFQQTGCTGMSGTSCLGFQGINRPTCMVTFPPQGCTGYTGVQGIIEYFPIGVTGAPGKTSAATIIQCTNTVCDTLCQDCNITLKLIQNSGGTLQYKADLVCFQPTLPCDVMPFGYELRTRANQITLGQNTYCGQFGYNFSYSPGNNCSPGCPECCTIINLYYGPPTSGPGIFGTLFISNLNQPQPCVPCPIISPCPTGPTGTAQS